MSDHPIDALFAQLISKAPKRKQQVLRAKIGIIRNTRNDAIHNGDNALLSQGRNAVAMGARFDAAVPFAERARDEMIAASLTCGVKANDAISAYVGAEIEHCLNSFARSRLASSGNAAGAGVAMSKQAVAAALGSRVRDQVLIARDAHDEALPPVVDQWTRRLLRKPWISVPAATGPWVFGLFKLWQELRELLTKLSH